MDWKFRLAELELSQLAAGGRRADHPVYFQANWPRNALRIAPALIPQNEKEIP
jgi:hypothetical protein